MDREELILDFLKNLKIALTNAGVYFKEHPIFIKSTRDLEKSIDNLIALLDPIKISIALTSLVVDNKSYKDYKVYEELSSHFHRRKIKNIKISKSVSYEELVLFLMSASLPAKELIKKGGLKNILNKENCKHIDIEELDYSQFLGSDANQDKYSWNYFLEEAIEEDNQQKINEFADKFHQVIKKIRPKDFIQDQELKNSMQVFLNYLKVKEKEKFKKCTKEILKAVLKDKNISNQEELKEMNMFIRDLEGNDLADALWEEISTDDSFDVLSFNLFFKLIDEKKHREIESFIIEKQNKGVFKVSPALKKRVKQLFSVPKTSIFEEIYRHAFDFLLKDIPFENEGFLFNRELVFANYRFVLINLFYFAKEKDKFIFLKDRIFKVWHTIIDDNDFDYFKYLLELAQNKEKEFSDFSHIFKEIEEKITHTIEDIAFSASPQNDINFLVDSLRFSTYDADAYLTKIFKEHKINSLILRLFFKFFPEGIALFCGKLDKEGQDIEFSINIIDSIKRIDLPYSVEALKMIFDFSNSFVKLEILKAMQLLSNYDNNFIAGILGKEDAFLKREALVILKNRNLITREILNNLLNLPSNFGRSNHIVIENIALIDELELKEAKQNLILLSKKPFFWNRNLRNKAKQILEKWQN